MLIVVVMVVAADETPDEESDSSRNQDHTDNMPLLGLKRATKLQTDGSDDPGKNDRREDVAN
jgi:hypothetical protein